jgi:predicted PurR-regulated permease PerM
VNSAEARSLIRYGVVFIAITVVMMYTLYLIRSQLLLIYVAALFATGLAPLVGMIERQRILPVGQGRLPRAAAILLIYGTVLGVLAGLVVAVAQPMTTQAQELWKVLPEKIESLQQMLVKWGVLQNTVTYKEVLQNAPAAGGADAVSTLLAAVLSIAGGMFGIVAILLLTFYLLVESQGVFKVFVRLFPRAQRRRVAVLSGRVAGKVSAWLGGQMLLGFIIGVTTAIGLAVMGVPYYFVLALVAGIGEMIPMVGPLISAVPAVLVALSVSPSLALAVTIFFIVQQALENNILVPKVLGQQVGLSAVTVIIALGIGSELFGLVGALLAVPTAAIIQVLFQELVLRSKPS